MNVVLLKQQKLLLVKGLHPSFWANTPFLVLAAGGPSGFILGSGGLLIDIMTGKFNGNMIELYLFQSLIQRQDVEGCEST